MNSLSPADGALPPGNGSNLVLDFSENVRAGAGTVVIKRSSDDSVVETIAVPKAQVTVSHLAKPLYLRLPI